MYGDNRGRLQRNNKRVKRSKTLLSVNVVQEGTGKRVRYGQKEMLQRTRRRFRSDNVGQVVKWVVYNIYGDGSSEQHCA